MVSIDIKMDAEEGSEVKSLLLQGEKLTLIRTWLAGGRGVEKEQPRAVVRIDYVVIRAPSRRSRPNTPTYIQATYVNFEWIMTREVKEAFFTQGWLDIRSYCGVFWIIHFSTFERIIWFRSTCSSSSSSTRLWFQKRLMSLMRTAAAAAWSSADWEKFQIMVFFYKEFFTVYFGSLHEMIHENFLLIVPVRVWIALPIGWCTYSYRVPTPEFFSNVSHGSSRTYRAPEQSKPFGYCRILDN